VSVLNCGYVLFSFFVVFFYFHVYQTLHWLPVRQSITYKLCVLMHGVAFDYAFSVAGPLAWNQLPASLRNMNCIATFKRHLKTVLFKAAYSVADN